jgi:hypothetical protein
MFGYGSKSSLISESVAKIRINIYLAKKKPHNTAYATFEYVLLRSKSLLYTQDEILVPQ